MAWTRERIVEALHDWTRLVGSPPRSYEWAPASARVLGRESPLSRLWATSHPRWPSTATVARRPPGGPERGAGPPPLRHLEHRPVVRRAAASPAALGAGGGTWRANRA